MQSSLIVFLVWVIRIASAVILFLPLVVTSSTFFPYIFSKIIFFQILVEFAVIPWVALMVISPAYRPRFRNPITLSLGIFILVLGLTSLTGIQPLHSL